MARKRKRMQPLGYTKDELLRMQRYAKTESNTNDLIEESFLNIRLISFQILHDKFGFGYKRLMKVEKIITEYLNTTAAGGLSTEQLQFYMREKCGIDAKAEANRVPFREGFPWSKGKLPRVPCRPPENFWQHRSVITMRFLVYALRRDLISQKDRWRRRWNGSDITSTALQQGMKR